MRLFVAGLRKLVRRPASYVSVGLLAGLLSLILIAVGATAKQTAERPNGAAALLHRLTVASGLPAGERRCSSSRFPRRTR